MILILSDHFDVHADIIENKLKHDNIKYFRLNLDVASLQKTIVTYDGTIWLLESEIGSIKSNQISCVWLRRAFVEVTLDQEDQNTDFKIWRGEWNKTLLGLYSSISDLPWMNKLRENSRAENKYYQARLASNAGFLVPMSITSNNKKSLIDFGRKYNEVVIKLMNQDFYRMNDGSFAGVYVNKVSLEDLSDFGDSQENPIVLQEYVPKLFEVRYTIVNDTHLACQIESQNSDIAKTDWRRYDLPNTPHYPIEPPEEIVRRSNKLMADLNLVYGALDFIVTPEQDWYFLEVNPTGQWLWIEDLTGLPISSSIVAWLSSKE